MIYLSAMDSLRLITATAADLDVYVGYTTQDDNLTIGRKLHTILTATTTVLLPSPIRLSKVDVVSVRNVDTVDSVVITLELYNGTTSYKLYKALLGAGESFQYDVEGFNLHDSNGAAKRPAISGYSITVGTVAPSNPQTNDLWVDTN